MAQRNNRSSKTEQPLSPKEVPARSASRWAQRLAVNPPIVPDAIEPDESHTNWSEQAERLQQHLLQKYHGTSLEDVYPLDTVITPEGSCAAIRSPIRGIPLQVITRSQAQALLRRELTLVRGVGPCRAEQCHQQGWETIDDLIRHPSFRLSAMQALQILDGSPEGAFRYVLDRRVSPSHPVVWWTTGFFRPEEFLFMDIESLGLFGTPVILIGVAEWTGQEILLTQYLARSIDEEPAVLHAFLAHATRKAAWITFNGRTFDAPMIRNRSAYYGMPLSGEMVPHYDLLHFARRAWKDQLPDSRAATIERAILGVAREDDLPGSYVPVFYDTYRRLHNIGPLTYILDHNRQDLLGMVGISSLLTQEWGQPNAS